MKNWILLAATFCGSLAWLGAGAQAEDFPKPYRPPCTEREGVFEFTAKPAVSVLGDDKYEISFAVKANCDVTVGIEDEAGKVVRHLGSGVLGANAPLPFAKNSLRQSLIWDGKDDLSQYPKDASRLKVRVALGLKPALDRLLGSTHPKNAPGHVWGIAIGPRGCYVFWLGEASRCNLILRQYDRDGNYLRTVYPPSNKVPLADLAGMGAIEFEQDRIALHGPDLDASLMKGILNPAASKHVGSCQPALANGCLYFPDFMARPAAGIPFSKMYGIRVEDGGKAPFMANRDFCYLRQFDPSLAASPDGRHLYACNILFERPTHTVYRLGLGDEKQAQPFVGDGSGKPSSGNDGFSDPQGLDCDSAGRIYVADRDNNRLQVFGPDGKHLKSLGLDRPVRVRAHPVNGSLYIVHQAWVSGKSLLRLTKFSAFPELKALYHNDEVTPAVLAVDGWSPKTRLWTGHDLSKELQYGYGGSRLCIWEEDGAALRKIADHDAEALREEGGTKLFHWDANGAMYARVVCNPSTERAYFKHISEHDYKVFDLASGKLVGSESLYKSDDLSFDKKNYLHSHLGPAQIVGVARYDPAQARSGWLSSLAEIPYDYGEEREVDLGGGKKQRFQGLLPVEDQPGAHGFQDGVGVNMRGDVAIETSIYNAPKMGDLSISTAWAGMLHEKATGAEQSEGGRDTRYARYLRQRVDIEKQGLDEYFIRRRPGIRLTGGTVWTFDSSGELRKECAFGVSAAVHGVQMDEAGEVYCVITDRSLREGKSFLEGRGFLLGGRDGTRAGRCTPHTGTLVKTRNGAGQILFERAPVPLEPTEFPKRPPDVESPPNCDGRGWVEDVSWIYAGASPIVQQGMCYCPTQRLHLDWYKRTYVPEGYRHSIGILDTNGNLILHLGRYGNWDDCVRMKQGETDICNTQIRFVGGTDRYLCFQDWGERLQVLKLEYAAEERVPLRNGER